MSAREKWKWAYKVVRSLLFTTIILIAFVYVLLYVLLSIPAVQNKVRVIAEKELSQLFTSRLEIGRLSIYPFNEVVVEDVALYEPDSSRQCARIRRLGAGISLWRLISEQKIVISYVELLGLDARLRQEQKDGPFNIDFLIQAFRPKDQNKPPTPFDLEIRNIVVRQCRAELIRDWIPEDSQKFPVLRELRLDSLNADLVLPKLKNDDIEIDLRRLAFVLPGLTAVSSLSGLVAIDSVDLSLHDIDLRLPHSIIRPADLSIPLHPAGGFANYIFTSTLPFSIDIPKLRPSDVAFLWPPLAALDSDLVLKIEGLVSEGNISLSQFRINSLPSAASSKSGWTDGDFNLSVEGAAAELTHDSESGKIGLAAAAFDRLALSLTPGFSSRLARMLAGGPNGKTEMTDPAKLNAILTALDKVEISAAGKVIMDSRQASLSLQVASGIGALQMEGDMKGLPKGESVVLSLHSEGLQIGRILSNEWIESVALGLEADVRLADSFDNLKHKRSWNAESLLDMLAAAEVSLNVPEAVLAGYRLDEVDLTFEKNGRQASLAFNSNDDNFNLSISGNAELAGAASSLNLEGDILRFRPAVISPLGRKLDFEVEGELSAALQGNSLDNLTGQLNLQHLYFNDPGTGRKLHLDTFDLMAHNEAGYREYTILSDWIEGGVRGTFRPTAVVGVVQGMLSEALPEFIKSPKGYSSGKTGDDSFTFDFSIRRGGDWSEFLNLPICLLYEATMAGELNGMEDMLKMDLSAPYIRQGRDKLIRGLHLAAEVKSGDADLDLEVIYPTKKGDLHLMSDLQARDGALFGGFDFNPERTTGFFGHLDIEADVTPSIAPLGKQYSVHILPSQLHLNDAAWNVADSWIRYYASSSGNMAEIDGFGISHDNQFVKVDGRASSDPEDTIIARLNEVDLDYIFDTLNINYVHFGGLATGEAIGQSLFSPSPVAETRELFVKDLSYNNGVLGDARLHGDFDLSRKRVGIRADISEDGRPAATVDGGIWIGRDSLSFAIDAEKVKIDFLYPFMQAFASKVEGRASGKAKLYGTFSDIDMEGRLFADTITLGVAYTNVAYSGRDSVIIDPGKIVIPSFTLRDQYGHTAILEGNLTHRYFHDPQFDFRISNARNLLLYDTNASMNPVWYGRIFGTGSGRILGIDNYVGITADMTTEANSNFTFVLSDREEALEYNFLTFTDRRKEECLASMEVEISEEDEILKAFRKEVNQASGPESVFGMDIRATITPATRLNLIMDPVAGDKITAHGSGAMNLTYQSDTDEMRMFGKYVLEQGVYNFSLQDLILKDFIIKSGSSISFNGDPMAGLLDIRAAYRVNTNLADLDQSFALDRDLNRTNVPVDAMLLVSGVMSEPDIKFDIELPTLNDEVEQKVRSVISSEEMMNLQMIYLLGLNRFYTPEYMGGTSGGEWASVASSTISSQLQNIMGQLTDKVSVLPSFKSDKGDFSDLEVDVALSSRLFNNRLLINGNFGYRDPSTSSTTFIGDFDIEYLLNRQGNWRLKAYNHFNDQNYYLKSALTTQGVGIVWRRDFNHIFGINKRRKDGEAESAAPADTIPTDTIPM